MASFIDPLPCGPYVTPEALLACCSTAVEAGYTVTSPQVLDAIADASLLLYYWTGRTYGTCEATVRPCRGCVGECRDCCCDPGGIELGLWPITNLTEVWYDGEAQPIENFHIDNFRTLVRSVDNDEPWPRCSNLWAAKGSPEDNETNGYVFEVSFEYGIPVPGMLERAARVLACELLNDACIGNCRLPEKVTTVSRRGLTMEVASSSELLSNNLTGLYQVDLAIRALNPSRIQSPAFVWTPDLARNKVHRVYT